MEGQRGIEAERAPVVNPRRRVTLGDSPFAVDAERALFPVHHDPRSRSQEDLSRPGRLMVVGVAGS